MLISYNWLKDLIDLSQHSFDTVLKKLTMGGLEVEGVEDTSAALKGVIVAQVLEKKQHPDADRLSLCLVDQGDEHVPVVCGAKNFEAGDYVAFAPVGTILDGDFKIKKAKIRGEISLGMICSEKELALSQQHDGIMKLTSGELIAGTALSAYLGRDDKIIEVGVTPNRPDALSHIGIARELAVSLGTSFHINNTKCVEKGGNIDPLVNVNIEDLAGCPRYTCRIIEGVQIKESPQWLKKRLEACGVRPINNIVDITNYMMYERGIPLHAFDYDKLALKNERVELLIRAAKTGEKLITLDGEERSLIETDLVIADSEKAIALAGVMGGANTEVSQNTTRVLLECAYFAPSRIRRTASRLKIHSDASHRFERGCDPNTVLQSLDSATNLIAVLGEGRIIRGHIDRYPKKIKEAEVTLRPLRVSQITGISEKIVNETFCSDLLRGIGLEVIGRESDGIRFKIPTFRPDLTREIDLIEEILRLYGYDNVEAKTALRTKDMQQLFDQKHHLMMQQSQKTLQSLGFYQAINIAFSSPTEIKLFGQEKHNSIVIQNPLGEEMSVMRQSLLPALLRNTALNQKRGTQNVRLYEEGRVFLGLNPEGQTAQPQSAKGPQGVDAYVVEKHRLGGVFSGAAQIMSFDQKQRTVDFYDLKGMLESLLEQLGLASDYKSKKLFIVAAEDDLHFYHPRARAHIYAKSATSKERLLVGHFGEIHPNIIEHYELKAPVFAFELDTENLQRTLSLAVTCAELPKYPAVFRDLAFVMHKDTNLQDFCQSMARADHQVSSCLESIQIFDIYTGKPLSEDQKSVAINISLRATDKTLSEKEILAVSSSLIAHAKDKWQAHIR